ncbi:MAG: bacillithiol biosynthesis cysteine-adding enzyme BshC [Pyrinomonadaceae bacterium]|nr:bacillithiol biosynthesis cysteine-adding enzyme BshC [Pyrinomonadaceae bacterium]
MKQEIVCPCPGGTVVLETESLPFSEIPHQSKLFIEYQQNPLSLKNYYPNIVESHTQIAARIPEVLANHKADRNLLCDALEEMNSSCGAGAKTLENIELLRKDDCVAVVTGQQAGLFSGPLYTIYKALSAVKMTECLRGRGFNAVPVFWIATEDHDFEEVSKTFVIERTGELAELKNEPKRCYENLPVGTVQLDDSIKETVSELFEELSSTEFTPELKDLIEKSWNPETYFGDAFAKLISKLFDKYGLIILCPLDPRLKRLAAPVYKEAIEKSAEIVDALRARSTELQEKGYHAQVLVGEDYFPLFWQAKDKTRNALKKSAQGTFKTKDNSREFSLDELASIAETEPTRFSPSVVLRSVVQDYILPTVCYFGGAAEIAYFAQSGEVYRILNRPQTTIFHRQSFSIIESKHKKTLEKYDLELKDLFAGYENILPEIVEKYLNSGTAKLFADAEEKINIELNRLDQNLSNIEPTLAENLAKRRRKILYHIGTMRTKFHHAQVRKDETLKRQIETMFSALLPHKNLQERTLNVNYFLNRYGFYFIDWIYQAIDLDDKGHRVIYL